MIAIVTALACRKGNHRMIHCRIGEGPARILMAIVTIDLRTSIHDWNMGFRIRIICYIHHIWIA